MFCGGDLVHHVRRSQLFQLFQGLDSIEVYAHGGCQWEVLVDNEVSRGRLSKLRDPLRTASTVPAD